MLGKTLGRAAKSIGKLSGGRRFMLLRLLPSAALATLIALPGSVTGDERPREGPTVRFENSNTRDDDGVARNLESRASEWEASDEQDITQVGVTDEDGDGIPDWDPSTAAVIDSLGASGIPDVALAAYVQAQEMTAESDPTCGLRWSLLAAIGRVESNHGRFGGAELRDDGYGTKPIRGVPLDGRPGVALIRDTDEGRLDGDAVYDRAVGPMQFIPSSWPIAAADGNGDGRSDPDNIYDAAFAAASYLCGGGSDLSTPAGRRAAVLRYNHSDEYANVVLSLAQAYEEGRADPLPPFDEPATNPPLNLDKPPKPPASTTTPPRGATPGSDRPATTTSTTRPRSTTTSTSTTTTSTTRPCPTTTTTTSTTTSTTTTTLPPSSTTVVPPVGSEPLPCGPGPTTSVPPSTSTSTSSTTSTTVPSTTTTQTTQVPTSSTSSSSTSSSSSSTSSSSSSSTTP
jgi:hypothetical protein